MNCRQFPSIPNTISNSDKRTTAQSKNLCPAISPTQRQFHDDSHSQLEHCIKDNFKPVHPQPDNSSCPLTHRPEKFAISRVNKHVDVISRINNRSPPTENNCNSEQFCKLHLTTWDLHIWIKYANIQWLKLYKFNRSLVMQYITVSSRPGRITNYWLQKCNMTIKQISQRTKGGMCQTRWPKINSGSFCSHAMTTRQNCKPPMQATCEKALAKLSSTPSRGCDKKTHHLVALTKNRQVIFFQDDHASHLARLSLN